MGTQIAIAQSHRDEEEILAMLRERGDFRAIPRIQSQKKFEPVALGESDAEDQLLFLADQANAVTAQTAENPKKPGQYTAADQDGLAIQWTRTKRNRKGEAQAGRFYLARPADPDMDKTMRALQRWIKKQYPMRSTGRHPTYIGPDLWRMIREGRAKLLHPNGSEVELAENS